jgi:hypothetical protein
MLTGIGLEYAGASLLGAGVSCEAAFVSNFGVGAPVEGVLPKKPRILF